MTETSITYTTITLDALKVRVEEINALIERAFDRPSDVVDKLEGRKHSHILIAESNGAIVGFKIGYALKKDVFYSWLGCVDPDFRHMGIASQLMRAQHTWCAENGFEWVETQTMNHFKDMLVLNLRHGFDIAGSYDDRGKLKIILRKPLRA